MKKLVILLLVLVVIIPVIVACKPDGVDSVTSNDTTMAPESEKKYLDDLPDELDFDGMQITTLYRNGNKFYAGEENGDIVFSTIYNTNIIVDERLNITRTFIPLQGEQIVDEISTSFYAQDHLYDYIPVDQYYGVKYCLEGMYADLTQSDYLNFDQPWYYSDYMNETYVGNDVCYFIAGDACPYIMTFSSCTFFNVDMFEDLYQNNGSLMYDYVNNHTWTLDKLREMCVDAYSDVNPNQKMDLGDNLGFATYLPSPADHFALTCGVRTTQKNEDGTIEVIAASEYNYDAIAKIFELWFETEGVHVIPGYLPGTDAWDSEKKVFSNGTALFHFGYLSDSFDDIIRSMDDSYGIVPRPLLDEKQPSYLSSTHNGVYLIGVLSNIPEEKWDAVCMLLEAQGSENYRKVYPAIFEQALQAKYIRDEANYENAVKMIDIIHDNIYTEFGYVYAESLSELGRFPGFLFQNISADYASYYAARATAIQEQMDELNLAFEELFD